MNHLLLLLLHLRVVYCCHYVAFVLLHTNLVFSLIATWLYVTPKLQSVVAFFKAYRFKSSENGIHNFLRTAAYR